MLLIFSDGLPAWLFVVTCDGFDGNARYGLRVCSLLIIVNMVPIDDILFWRKKRNVWEEKSVGLEERPVLH